MPAPLLFVTGFPGFIGNRLVARLVADDPEARIVALVEARMAERAREAAQRIDAERVEVLEGDISERDLGISAHDYERLTAEMTSAFHLAAIYDLAVPLELAQRVNVDGTGNVVELCRRAERLQRHNYVSTAYVAGLRHGVIYEHELVMGQGFKNHYESTKFQAEVWVRESMSEVPTTVYRPAIVVGDSQTGETQKFDGPYYMLRLIARAVARDEPIVHVGRGAAPFNVVPVDYIIDALVAGSRDERAVGDTLHLVDPDPVTAHELTSLLSREYAGREPRFSVPAPLIRQSLRIPAVRRAFSGTPPESIRYLDHAVRFDTRQAGDLLRRQGMRCPVFAEYVGAMVAFFREHEDDPAFAPRDAG